MVDSFFLTSILSIKDVTFLNTGEAVLINNAYNIISAPTSWALDSKTIYNIDDTSIQSKNLLGISIFP